MVGTQHRPGLTLPGWFAIVKWTSLASIAIMTALVGFFQSILVASLYRSRFNSIYSLTANFDSVGRAKALQEYLGYNLVLALGCSMALFVISPAASGSGVPDVKAFLNGVESPIFDSFFTIKTFVAKVIGSALAVASGLAMGKEGPMLHAGSILSVIIGNHPWLRREMEKAAHWGVYTYNRDLRDMVACGAAMGVTTAFKAPLGGLLFAMELTTRWRKELTWRCFFGCAVTIVVVRAAILQCAMSNHCKFLKWGSLIWFTQTYPTPYHQVWAMIILAVMAGYCASLWTSFNTWFCIVRKRWGKRPWARVLEVGCISLATSLIFFWIPVVGTCKRCGTKSSMNCIATGSKNGQPIEIRTFTAFGCPAGHYNDLAVMVFNPQGFLIQSLFSAQSGAFSIGSLALYMFTYWVMGAITYGAFLPSGVFTPSLIIGGCFGRLYAEILVQIGAINGSSGEGYVAMYALLGAGSFMGGLMRLSASSCLILMEMTNAPFQLPFLALVLIISKGVGDFFNYSVFDHQIMLKGLGYVGFVSETTINKSKVQAGGVMQETDMKFTFHIVESGGVLQHALNMDKTSKGFPVIDTPRGDEPGGFMGMITRKSVEALLAQYGTDCEAVPLAERLEVAPIIVPPNMPLAYIYHIVNTLGLTYIPVIRHHGPLEGVVSRQNLVDIENKKLDTFRMQEHIDLLSAEVEESNPSTFLRTVNRGGRQMMQGHVSKPLLDARRFVRRVRSGRHREEEDEDAELWQDAPIAHYPNGGAAASASRSDMAANGDASGSNGAGVDGHDDLSSRRQTGLSDDSEASTPRR